MKRQVKIFNTFVVAFIALFIMSGCSLSKPNDNIDGAYKPMKGDWVQYNLYGNVQMKLVILDVEQGTVFMMREYSIGGVTKRNEEVEVPIMKLRRYISDNMNDLKWEKIGNEIIDHERKQFNAELFEAKDQDNTIKCWYSSEIPVTGVMKVKRINADGSSSDRIYILDWGRLERKSKAK